MFRSAILVLLSSLSLAPICLSQMTIPAEPTSPTPTCLGRLYTDILVPSGWGDDANAGTRFIQSDEGALGLTIEYELRVNGNANTYWQSGSQAMFGIGEVSINRWLNNEKVVRIED